MPVLLLALVISDNYPHLIDSELDISAKILYPKYR